MNVTHDMSVLSLITGASVLVLGSGLAGMLAAYELNKAGYKVRILDGKLATRAKTRVLIESADKSTSWNTVGVSENIITASFHALVDSIEYKLLAAK